MSPVPQQLGYPIHRKAFLVIDWVEDRRYLPLATGGAALSERTADFGVVPRGHVWLLDRAMATATTANTDLEVVVSVQPSDVPLNSQFVPASGPIRDYREWIRDWSDLKIVQGTYNEPIIVPEQWRLCVNWYVGTDPFDFQAWAHVEYRVARLHQATLPESVTGGPNAAIVIGG
jgi:hypothetical protein